MIRTAEVTVRRMSEAATVTTYLPANYEVIDVRPHPVRSDWSVVVIAGYDNAGWSLDDYVIPRLGSGLYACVETTRGKVEA